MVRGGEREDPCQGSLLGQRSGELCRCPPSGCWDPVARGEVSPPLPGRFEASGPNCEHTARGFGDPKPHVLALALWHVHRPQTDDMATSNPFNAHACTIALHGAFGWLLGPAAFWMTRHHHKDRNSEPLRFNFSVAKLELS